MNLDQRRNLKVGDRVFRNRVGMTYRATDRSRIAPGTLGTVIAVHPYTGPALSESVKGKTRQFDWRTDDGRTVLGCSVPSNFELAYEEDDDNVPVTQVSA